ncbi:CoA transferase [Comamonas sp. Y33R10-2]|uniref:CaiB/BaiF CoA transferase family protein n=1 Tax=Comamonas sp. Y33R10-2 TaxID=2853257 RepID=UPI001C5CAF9C|nr:CaiB/BaiF CoA-transferase family protein [Comamonas sp. Y33R10-2]QXZ11378.1 CoA transferase [Comamonas sp. Y33R10-2]
MRVIEFAAIGPAPFAGMMLADMGAEVILIERSADFAMASHYPRMAQNRGKKSVALDLKSEAGREAAWKLIESADALIEGFRPGVMERLGFSPEEVAKRAPSLVFGRVTGWGQTGPLAQAAGHDINYVALTGVMSTSMRPGQAPVLPPTIVGDMAGGAMFLLFGIQCAMFEAQKSGKGQVVDAAMIDGVAAMSGLMHQMRSAMGYWKDDPAQNHFLNTSPFYEVFECADGKHITLGAIEPQFYALQLQKLGLSDVDPKRQYQTTDWPEVKARVADIVRSKTQAQWCAELEGSDVCFAPVLTLAGAPSHPHNAERNLFIDLPVDGKTQRQPAPAPRLSRTPARQPVPGTKIGQDTDAVLSSMGYAAEDIAALRESKACA